MGYCLLGLGASLSLIIYNFRSELYTFYSSEKLSNVRCLMFLSTKYLIRKRIDGVYLKDVNLKVATGLTTKMLKEPVLILLRNAQAMLRVVPGALFSLSSRQYRNVLADSNETPHYQSSRMLVWGLSMGHVGRYFFSWKPCCSSA